MDRTTAKTTSIVGLAAELNALDAAPDGTLYGAGMSSVYTIDPSTGALAFFASYPPGYTSSGDLAVLRDGTMVATASRPDTTDSLLSIDLTTGNVTVVGETGFQNVWGLAAQGASLFGFTAAGEVLSLDTTTGVATLLGDPGPAFYGASAR